MSIDIIVDIAVTPGRLDAALAGFTDLVRETRAEPGCHRFDLLVPQGTPDALILVETWADRSAIDLHMQQDYTRRFIDDSSTFLAAPPSAKTVTLVAI